MEYMKLVWYAYKHRPVTIVEHYPLGIGFTTLESKEGDSAYEDITYSLHPKMKELIEEAKIVDGVMYDKKSKHKKKKAEVQLYKAGNLLRKENGNWRKKYVEVMEGFIAFYEDIGSTDPSEVRTNH